VVRERAIEDAGLIPKIAARTRNVEELATAALYLVITLMSRTGMNGIVAGL
jgi:hypothetical protein